MLKKVHWTNGLPGKLALAVIGCLVLAQTAQASIDFLGGTLIPATPFDRKVDSARAFSSYNFSSPFAGAQSVDELFLLARSIRYVSDGNQDYWQTPQETQARWAGDCEDKAVWLYAQLKRNGYTDIRLVVGRYRSVDKGYHVWITMTDGQDGLFILDPTSQKKIWQRSDFLEGFYRPIYSFDGVNRYHHES